jgi:acyl-CoA synthetase (AMP-forming)/AMP-acid ligase II
MSHIDVEQLLAGLPSRISAIPRRWADSAPQRNALHDGARHWTYGELAEAVNACTSLLRRLEMRPGDRLMVVGENCVAQIALTFAAASIDAWIVHVNGRLSAREVDQIRDHSGARRVLYTAAVSPEAAAHGARHGAVPVADVGDESTLAALGVLLAGPLNADAVPELVAASSAEQVAALVYTTGTTGQPKGVMLTHRNLLFIAAVSSTIRGLTPHDRAYCVLPISHVYGLTSVTLGTLYAGACLYLCSRYSPDALLKAIRDDRITILQGVPAMYARLLEQLGGPGTPLPNHLRFIYAGGSPLTPALKAAAEQLLGLPLHNGYGMTETSPTVSQTRFDQPRSDTSVGSLIPGVEARIVDADGADVRLGDPGELWIRGPNVMLGYYKAPDLTAAAMRPGGWLNTGDMARQDADGALFIVGRTKELIIRSGFNVYPLEVETVLNAHPAVTQSAVVGRSTADGNEEVVAFVEVDPRHSVTTSELQAYLEGQLSPYKCPSEIVVMQALPAAATGKILKSQLRDLANKDSK